MTFQHQATFPRSPSSPSIATKAFSAAAPDDGAPPHPADALIAPADIELLARARGAFTEHGEATAAAFYDTLFLNSPDLRPLFPVRMTNQRRKLAATLALVIDAARDPAVLGPVLDALARRHLAYGVRRRHYAAVGETLLATLETAGLPAVELAAWERAYAAISTRMIAAAYPQAQG